MRGEQLLHALGHAVHGVGERGEELAARRRRARLEVAVAEVARGLAQGFQIAPDRAHPEPERDAEDDADQAPGQQAQAQIERQAVLEFRVAVGGQRADHQHLAAGAEAVVHDVAVVVDGDVAGVELGDLGGGQGAVEGDALDDAQAVGELLVKIARSCCCQSRRGVR